MQQALVGTCQSECSRRYRRAPLAVDNRCSPLRPVLALILVSVPGPHSVHDARATCCILGPYLIEPIIEIVASRFDGKVLKHLIFFMILRRRTKLRSTPLVVRVYHPSQPSATVMQICLLICVPIGVLFDSLPYMSTGFLIDVTQQ